MRAGFVSQQRDGGYELGEFALQLGLSALRKSDFVSLARDALSVLSSQIEQTVAMAVWSDHGPVIVEKIESHETSMFEIRIGTVCNLMSTATGNIFLAWLPETKWKPVLLRQSAVDDQTALLAHARSIAESVRTSGMAFVKEAYRLPDFSGAAAPIFDHTKSLRGAFALLHRSAGPSHNGDKQLLVATARRLSGKLGLPPHAYDGLVSFARSSGPD
jgi:DNA-binding IclR family transcriptional regulator